MAGDKISRVAAIGTGTIGASWTVVFLAHELTVAASDPADGRFGKQDFIYQLETDTYRCPAGEQPTTTQQATEVTLERRIENALKDLEIFNARAYKPDNLQATAVTLERMIDNALKDLDSATVRALKADQERLNDLMRKSGIYR